MKKIILFFSLLIFISLLTFVFIFHSEPVKFNTVTVKNKFSISIPEYLFKTDSIDPSASLQYKNEKEQLFLLAYEKADTLHLPIATLFKNFADNFIARIGHGNLLKYYPKQINGCQSCQAVIGNIRGNVNETGVYYRIEVIEAGNSYYEIIAGISENNLTSFDDDINNILESIIIFP